MLDDDRFDGFGALTCRDCGTSLELRWRRTTVTFDCLECGTSSTVARRGPHRRWFHRRPRPAPAETEASTVPTRAPTA